MISARTATLMGAHVRQGAVADDSAFAALYREHARYIAGVVFRVAGNDLDLDDVVQEAFVSACSHLDQLRDTSSIRAWLVAIAIRSLRRHMARRRRQWRLAMLFARTMATSSDPRARTAVDDLYDALARIPADLRIPWALAHIEQLTLPEVARACGVSLTTIKRRISDADQRIQRRLVP